MHTWLYWAAIKLIAGWTQPLIHPLPCQISLASKPTATTSKVQVMLSFNIIMRVINYGFGHGEFLVVIIGSPPLTHPSTQKADFSQCPHPALHAAGPPNLALHGWAMLPVPKDVTTCMKDECGYVGESHVLVHVRVWSSPISIQAPLERFYNKRENQVDHRWL